MLEVEGISKSLGSLQLNGVSFRVPPGEYFVLLGKSGVGKSVLLEIIGGLLHPDDGRVSLDGHDITDQSVQNRNVAMVFQQNCLFGHLSVYDNVAYPLRCLKRTVAEIKSRVQALADDFGFSELLPRKADILSGGEIQRISLARAVAAEPRCLLLDEPVSSLDVGARPQIYALLKKIKQRGKQMVIHVTHDYMEAARLATTVAVMEQGSILQSGSVSDIFHHPASEFVARFAGIRNFLRGTLGDGAESNTESRLFVREDLEISIMSDAEAGQGCVMIRSEDVTLSTAATQTSARNSFAGLVLEVVPAYAGMEVIIDIGGQRPLELAALISRESADKLALKKGKKVWASFKASAIKFISEHTRVHDAKSWSMSES